MRISDWSSDVCSSDLVPIVLGDARLELAKQPPGRFDTLVIDAFSSDAIPLHLPTREAVGIYARVLKPDGILLIHISNRFFDLEPVLAAEAKARGWSARSEEHTSELQSLMRISYAVFCLN